MKQISIISICNLIAIIVILIITTHSVSGMTNERKALTNGVKPETAIMETPAFAWQNVSTTEDPLITFIRSIQNKYVKISYHETNCYTDIDYRKFIDNGTTEKIKNEIKENKEFKALVDRIKNLTPENRNTLLKKAQGTCQQTWAQQGTINSKGQTDAGQSAQLDIADAIVALIQTKLQ
jgi:hypothetical protein